MLSRTADHLFWMSRYTERAENTARMLNVNYETSLLPQSASRGRGGLAGPAVHQRAAAGLHRAAWRRQRAQRDGVHGQDEDNPSSIISCLRAARENARAVRGTLTTEVWETQNQTWLEVNRMLKTGEFERDPAAVLRMGQVPLAPLARRDRGHHADGRSPVTSCAWAPSWSAPTTPRAWWM
jgi:uncharacterized alpha-E superfamily protein